MKNYFDLYYSLTFKFYIEESALFYIFIVYIHSPGDCQSNPIPYNENNNALDNYRMEKASAGVGLGSAIGLVVPVVGPLLGGLIGGKEIYNISFVGHYHFVFQRITITLTCSHQLTLASIYSYSIPPTFAMFAD